VELGHRARLAATDDAIKRQDTLEYEIRSTVDTIANGGLQSSRALAEKLRELEAERDHLSRQAPAQRKIVSIVPQVANLFREKVKELPQLAKADPDRGRMLLRRLIGGSLRLLPQDGRLVAEFEPNGTRPAAPFKQPAGFA
jgi:aminoglycoside/choline kinase family phosphotransferase